MAIEQVENHFSYDDYIEERTLKESTLKGAKAKDAASQAKKEKAQDSGDESGAQNSDEDMDDEEEEKAALHWDRAAAEKMYSTTRSTLGGIYNQR